jgi:hypothetical protein
VGTFFHVSDESGKVCGRSKHYACVSFQEVRIYVPQCLGPIPIAVLDTSGTESLTSIISYTVIFTEQARKVSSHLLTLNISMVDDTIKSGLQECLDRYQTFGPSLLLLSVNQK